MRCSLQVSEERVRNGAGALEALSHCHFPRHLSPGHRAPRAGHPVRRGATCARGTFSSSPRLRPLDARSTPTTLPNRQTKTSPAVGKCPLGAQSPQLGTSDPLLTTLGPFPFPYSAPERERETDPMKDQLLPRTYTVFPWGQCDPCLRNNLKKPRLPTFSAGPRAELLYSVSRERIWYLQLKVPGGETSHRN